ncbi:hypothetical protein HYR99_02505 [Candidatus Poribacteria bacterium]|nr:hypothetical protein [Candidatus Poribacteria bacterium]
MERQTIRTIYRDINDVLWFGGDGGVLRYDGEAFVTFTTEGVFSHNGQASRQGRGSKSSRFHRHPERLAERDPDSSGQLVPLTADLQLPKDSILIIHRTANGIVWFGTEHHGLVGYDGTAFTRIDSRDGLAGSSVYALASGTDRWLWGGPKMGG